MKNGESLENCTILTNYTNTVNLREPNPFYNIFLFEGTGTVKIDLTEYDFSGKIVLFTTPYQFVRFNSAELFNILTLQFHGDFYCIEYHKKEVACNGLLFNNIYLQPFIELNDDEFIEIRELFNKLSKEVNQLDTYSQAVVRAYLQLVLALSSKIKIAVIDTNDHENINSPVLRFKTLLETHFNKERQPAFYAEHLGISPNAFSKQCKIQFKRSPSGLIQERVILEAKKLIHLTYKSMKEIAAELNFDDENYFSRYFKKHTGITPTTFRETVGISIVADLSR